MKFLYTKANVDAELGKLFDQYVPFTGKANTVGGEIVRAIARIGYRNFNDGDHIGVGYGNETCNAPARYLSVVIPDMSISGLIGDMWGTISDTMYDAGLEKLEMMILLYLHNHMELFETANNDDMWNHKSAMDFNYGEDEDY